MQYNTIRGTDLQVSAVGMGCNNFGMRCDESQSLEVVSAARHGTTSCRRWKRA